MPRHPIFHGQSWGLTFLLPDMSSKVKKKTKPNNKNPKKPKLFSSDSRNSMFCVTQISTFQFGFKRCQVARGGKKRDIKERGWYFQNQSYCT